MGTSSLVESATFMYWVNQFLYKIAWHHTHEDCNLDTQCQ